MFVQLLCFLENILCTLYVSKVCITRSLVKISHSCISFHSITVILFHMIYCLYLKTQISNSVYTARLWNNLLHVRSQNRIGGGMVSVFASSVVDRGFESRSGQTKDFKIGICCFSTKHTALRSKNKDKLALNQGNVSECLSADCCFSELAL